MKKIRSLSVAACVCLGLATSAPAAHADTTLRWGPFSAYTGSTSGYLQYNRTEDKLHLSITVSDPDYKDEGTYVKVLNGGNVAHDPSVQIYRTPDVNGTTQTFQIDRSYVGSVKTTHAIKILLCQDRWMYPDTCRQAAGFTLP